MFAYLIPMVATLTIPMGVLFGVIFALSRLSGDNEIIAIRANGISFGVVMWTTFLFGLMMTVVSFIFINYITPKAVQRYKTLYFNILYLNPNIALEKRQFFQVPNTKKKIAAVETSKDGKSMKWVFIYEEREEEREEIFIHAERGRWIDNAGGAMTTLELENGQLLRIVKGVLDNIERSDFEKINFNIKNDFKQIDLAKGSPEYMDVFKLAKVIKKKKQQGNKISPIYSIEFHKKFAYPLACVIFVLIAMPLSIFSSRSGGGVSFGLTIVIIFFYYLMMVLTETLAKRGFLNPAIGMYIPVMITACIAFFLLFRSIRKEFQ